MASKMITQIRVPIPDEEFSITLKDRAAVKVRRYINNGKPCLVLSHGNGFAIDAYAPFWEPLLEKFELCIYDQRHHGWNNPAPIKTAGFELFANDLDNIITRLRKIYPATPLFGVYHSLSAIAALLHATSYSNPLDALILFDPPLQPPKGHVLYDFAYNFEMMLSGWSRKRQKEFHSPDELADQFIKSRSLSGWISGAHHLMAQSTLKQYGDKWYLICPPDIESQIYLDSANLIMWDFYSKLDIPVAIINADPGHPAKQAPAQVCTSLINEIDVPFRMIEGTTHLLQIEKPQECRNALFALLRQMIA
jgi:pimeloyl-ACP methyl ester carboxylesterase